MWSTARSTSLKPATPVCAWSLASRTPTGMRCACSSPSTTLRPNMQQWTSSHPSCNTTHAHAALSLARQLSSLLFDVSHEHAMASMTWRRRQTPPWTSLPHSRRLATQSAFSAPSLAWATTMGTMARWALRCRQQVHRSCVMSHCITAATATPGHRCHRSPFEHEAASACGSFATDRVSTARARCQSHSGW